MPTPTIRGSFGSAATTITTGNVAGTLPAGIQTGDMGLLAIGTNVGTSTLTVPPAGWTLTDGPITTSSNNVHAWLYSRSMLASDASAAITATLSASGFWQIGGIILIGAEPLGQAISWVDNADDLTLPIPAITPAGADELLITVASIRYTTTTTGVTAAGGWNERQDVATTSVAAPRFGLWIGSRGLTGQAGIVQTAVNQTLASTGRSVGWITSFAPPPSDLGLRWFVHKAGALSAATLSPPSPLPATPPGSPPPTTWFGWDTTSVAIPPRFSTIDANMRAWTDNTGLLNQANLDALAIHNGDLDTSTDGQIIEWLHITGAVNVNHDNVTIKLCRIDGRVNVGVASGVTVIHCERGDEQSGDRINTGYRGRVRMYRCLSYGLTDTWQSWTGGPASSGLSIFEDNCGHSLRTATDANQSSGYTHNDFIQVNSSGVTIQSWRNTWLLWGLNNYTSLESCTRDSGQRWVDVDGDPLNVTGYNGQTGGIAEGRTNSGYRVGAGSSQTPLTVTVDGDYFRGYVYSYGQCPQGSWMWRNCLFAENENEAGWDVVTRDAAVVEWTNNRNYQTNAIIPWSSNVQAVVAAATGLVLLPVASPAAAATAAAAAAAAGDAIAPTVTVTATVAPPAAAATGDALVPAVA